jgi:hypothetical protein
LIDLERDWTTRPLQISDQVETQEISSFQKKKGWGCRAADDRGTPGPQACHMYYHDFPKIPASVTYYVSVTEILSLFQYFLVVFYSVKGGASRRSLFT